MPRHCWSGDGPACTRFAAYDSGSRVSHLSAKHDGLTVYSSTVVTTIDLLPEWRPTRMSTNYAFHPKTVEALATAFHKSWSFLSTDPRFAAESPSLLQQRLSECLMELAADGEHDPLRLANGAVSRMRHEYSPKLPDVRATTFHQC